MYRKVSLSRAEKGQTHQLLSSFVFARTKIKFTLLKQRNMSASHRRSRFISIFSILLLLMVGSCNDTDISGEPIPFASFPDIEINLSFQEALQLRNLGYMTIRGGVRGIIVHRAANGEYIAFERNCSYEPNNSCALVEVDQSGFFMIDKCCESTFDFPNGFPNSGPATFPLRRYRTILSGDLIIIQDEPLP